jgi:DNA (cytosine-5)-methyltransferase 1
METIGYEVQSFIIPACAVGAPHRRDRVWIVAHSSSTRPSSGTQRFGVEKQERLYIGLNGFGKKWTFAHADLIHAAGQGYGQAGCTDGAHQSRRNVPGNGAAIRFGNERVAAHTAGTRWKRTVQQNTKMPAEPFRNFPAQSPVCGGDDGIPDRLDGIAFSKWRNESIKAYGNAIVPQIAYQIFKAIETVEYSKSIENEKAKEN